MKFLHCSDTHLGKKPYFGSDEFKNKRFEDYFSAFDRIIEQAIENNAQAIIIAGDFFDKKESNPIILSKTEVLLEKCKKNNIDLIVIEGNHDLIYKNKEDESWLIYLENKKLLQRPFVQFNENNERDYHFITINGINIFGLGYPGASVDDELIKFAGYCGENNIQNCIVLVHTALSKNDFISGFLKDNAALDLLKDHIIYIAGGHGHKLNMYPDTQPFFFVPGSPEYFDLGEDREKKTAIVFDTDSKEHKIIQQNPRNCINKLFTANAANPEQFREEFSVFLSSFEITKEDIVNVEIKSNCADFIPDLKWAEKQIMEKGALYSSVKLLRDNMRSGSNSIKNTSVEEIELEQIKKWESWNKAASIASNALSQMKKSLKDGLDDISDIFDSALNNVIGGKNEN